MSSPSVCFYLWLTKLHTDMFRPGKQTVLLQEQHATSFLHATIYCSYRIALVKETDGRESLFDSFMR